MGHNTDIRRAVAYGHCFEDEETLRAYSYDASGTEELPVAVVKPAHEEELRRLLQAANQNRLAIVPRGAGTNTRAETVKASAVIVDMRRFDAVERVDLKGGTVTVGAGATAAALNEALSRHGVYFPLIPENPCATLGGLVSQNHLTEESQLFGDYTRMVVGMECFDGLGRYHALKEENINQMVGWEGTMGIIVKLTLKVYPVNHKVTLDIYAVKDADEAAGRLPRLKEVKGVLMIEYLDAATSSLVGLDEHPHLMVGYANDHGSYKDQIKIANILRRRKGIEPALWEKGLTLMEEATLGPEKAGAFEALCRKEGVPCYGHIGLGVMLTAMSTQEQRSRMLSGIVALGGVPAGKHGYGRLKKEYVPAGLRRRALHLKEERDYNQIMNPGVIV